MNIGLLICDHVDLEIQSRFGDYPDMFSNLFPHFSWKFYDVINGQFPVSENECEAYLITGSAKSVYDEDSWIQDLMSFIRNAYDQKIFIIGICFGHQIIAESLGGKVEKSKNGWCVGVHTFKMKSEERWMQPFKNNINLLMSCEDQVVNLPKNCQVLAESPMCPYGMYTIGPKVIAVQGHPEFSKEYASYLINKRIKLIGEKKVREAQKSMNLSLDVDILVNWITRFIQIQ